MVPRGMPIDRDDKDVRDGAVTNANVGDDKRFRKLSLQLIGATRE